MNEVDELSKLDVQSLPPLRPMVLDDLHSKALKNLHLEMGTGPVLYLLCPSYSVLHPTASEVITDFTTTKESLLDYLREYIIRNLAVSPVLLAFKRKHYGVKELIASVKDQNERMIDKAQEKLKNPLEYKSFFQEIKELVAELRSESLLILQSLPPHLDFAKVSDKDLIDINAQYRTINHYIIELHDEVEEFENLLHFHKENDFARYVTKYKKDVTNLISYFNIKINGFLTQKIYGLKNKEK